MKHTMLLITLLFLVYFVILPVPVKAQLTWKDIIPLKTTRDAAERILGISEPNNCRVCQYRTESEEISISYSEAPCKGVLSGWKIPSNVVLTVSVIFRKETLLSEFNLVKETILYYPISGSEVAYVIQNRGIVYDVNEFTKIVTRIRFMPSESDNQLRCKGFPPYNPIGTLYHPELNFYRKNSKAITAFLDIPILVSQNAGDKYKTYIIAYCGKDLIGKKYNDLLAEMRRHAYEKMKVSSKTFEIIDGGKRNNFGLDVFRVAKALPPPVASPTNLSCFGK